MIDITTQQQIISISNILPNNWNPNEMDEQTYKAEKESLERYGVIAPIIVRPKENKYEIVDGEHRHKVCEELGYTDIPCVIIKNLSDEDAKKLTIILNETKGTNDKIELGKLLKDLKTSFGDDLKTGLPLSDNDITELIELGNANWDEYDIESNQIEGDEEEYRLHLTFKGNDQIDLVKEKLANNPEEKIIELLNNND